MTKTYSEKTINNYLEKLASKEPAPGGGSAAALVGAIGVACLTKVVNFTIGKEKYKDVETEMKNYLKRLEEIESAFQRLCSDDAVVYSKLSEAFKMPKNEECARKIQLALKEAMAVPLEVCKKSHEAIVFCAPVAEKGNKNLISDVGCARCMLKCAYQAALLNVETNLKSIKDEKFVAETKKILESMEGEMQ
ncbi:MAG: cyclodeaminase/cyclohydrolase family protein [Candidatus Omnitrophica bacterium]|nr:cyclodeaminase/cyclohydrolase family protein [Candidatus Omnitrophota bacterium]